MDINEARESFVWPMQQVVGNRTVMVAFVKHKLDSDKEWLKLEENGIESPWVTFKIPYPGDDETKEDLALVMGEIEGRMLVRVHSECFTGDVLHS